MNFLRRKKRTGRLILGILGSWLALHPAFGNEQRYSAAGKKGAAFWQKKAVGDWTTQEVQLFLRDSPWAKSEKVIVTIKNLGGPEVPQSAPVVGAPRIMRYESCCHSFEIPVEGSNLEPGAHPHGASAPDFSKGTVRAWAFDARVFWFSSITYRRAMIRLRQLLGIPVESEAALAPSNDFVLGLGGSLLRLLEGLPPDEVRTKAFIRSARRKKRNLSPAEYIPAQPSADPMAFLIFPKTQQEGIPVFSREDGALTLSMKGADFELNCEFPLEPMVVDGKLDW